MDDENDGPRLKVIAANTRQQIKANELQERIDYTLRALAANIIRVVRGAGRPDDIIDQCSDVLKAAIDFDEEAERPVSLHSVAAALHLKPERIHDDESFEGLRQLAMRKMIDGSLQVAASRLLSQQTQEHRGKSEMLDGYRDLEHIYQDVRERQKARARIAGAKMAPKRKPIKKKAKKDSSTNES